MRAASVDASGTASASSATVHLRARSASSAVKIRAREWLYLVSGVGDNGLILGPVPSFPTWPRSLNRGGIGALSATGPTQNEDERGGAHATIGLPIRWSSMPLRSALVVNSPGSGAMPSGV